MWDHWGSDCAGDGQGIMVFGTNLESHPLLNAELIYFLTKSEISETLEAICHNSSKLYTLRPCTS